MATRKPKSALLLIDVISDFDFEGGAALLRQAAKAAPVIVRLIERARTSGVPVIYCNDNFGRWRSDRDALIRHVLDASPAAARVVGPMQPQENDYFLIKPRHSAFYETPLENLLEYLNAKHLVLAGFAGDGCIHTSATDAHVRKYEVTVCSDATASQTPARNTRALTHLREVGYARVLRQPRIAFAP
jgi:nicotinamidase-related amidase